MNHVTGEANDTANDTFIALSSSPVSRATRRYSPATVAWAGVAVGETVILLMPPLHLY